MPSTPTFVLKPFSCHKPKKYRSIRLVSDTNAYWSESLKTDENKSIIGESNANKGHARRCNTTASNEPFALRILAACRNNHPCGSHSAPVDLSSTEPNAGNSNTDTGQPCSRAWPTSPRNSDALSNHSPETAYFFPAFSNTSCRRNCDNALCTYWYVTSYA